MIRLDDGWAAVEGVTETGSWEPVYNFRISAFHTYFVGCEAWGFSVWAHNSYGEFERIVTDPRLKTKLSTTEARLAYYKDAKGGEAALRQGLKDAGLHHTAIERAVAVAKTDGLFTPPRVPIPGDADFTGTAPKTWTLAPAGDGAHMVERSNVVGRPGLAVFDQVDTPRFYPASTPGNAGAAHVRLHEATRDAGIRLRAGGNPHLTDPDLLSTYRTAYADPRLAGIRGDLRTPSSSIVVTTDVTPAQAYQALLRHYGF